MGNKRGVNMFFSTKNKEPLDLEWEKIPFYRKRRFLLLCIFFPPGFIILGAIGDNYTLEKGNVYVFFESKWLVLYGIFYTVSILYSLNKLL
jgi:hypothetical protein